MDTKGVREEEEETNKLYVLPIHRRIILEFIIVIMTIIISYTKLLYSII